MIAANKGCEGLHRDSGRHPRAVTQLRLYNFAHLVAQGAYLVLESTWNYPCFGAPKGECACSIVVLSGDFATSQHTTCLKHASFFSQFFVEKAARVKLADHDPVGLLIGLDNGRSVSSSNFLLAAVLFLAVSTWQACAKSSAFSSTFGGAMWLQHKENGRSARRRLYVLVTKVGQRRTSLKRYFGSLVFVQSLLQKMDFTAGKQQDADFLSKDRADSKKEGAELGWPPQAHRLRKKMFYLC